VAAAAGDVAEGLSQEGLADPDRADDSDVGMGFEERSVTSSFRSC